MIAFQIQLNGKTLCNAGVGHAGVLGAHVSWIRGNKGLVRSIEGRRMRQELILDLGGLTSERGEPVRWQHRNLKVGDQVLVRVVEATKVDRPRRRKRRDPAQELKARKAYVRRMVNEVGWSIQTERC